MRAFGTEARPVHPRMRPAHMHRCFLHRFLFPLDLVLLCTSFLLGFPTCRKGRGPSKT